MTLTRRHALLGSALVGLGGPASGQTPPLRVASLGWASAQTLMALGVTPLTLPEISRYRRLVVEPAPAIETRELGLRSEPNLELLKALNPDLIVGEAGADVSRSLIERIAPLETFIALQAGAKPVDVARASTLSLAARLARPEAAATLLSEHAQALATARDRLSGYKGGPLCLVSDVFGNRALVFGRNSLYQDVLDHVGIENAFTGATSLWGHATVGLDVLAALGPRTRLVVMTSRLPSLESLLAIRPLWRALPFLREGRVTMLSDILFYGGLPSAMRFARLLGDKLPLDGARG